MSCEHMGTEGQLGICNDVDCLILELTESSVAAACAKWWISRDLLSLACAALYYRLLRIVNIAI